MRLLINWAAQVNCENVVHNILESISIKVCKIIQTYFHNLNQFAESGSQSEKYIYTRVGTRWSQKPGDFFFLIPTS